MTTREVDQQTLELARQVRQMAQARQTFLFGSRARGDHRPDSDVDILVITGSAQPDSWLEELPPDLANPAAGGLRSRRRQ